MTKPQSWLGNFPLCPALVGNVDRVHIVEYTEEVLDTICCTWNAIKPFSVAIYCYGKSDVWLDNTAEEIETHYPEIAVLWHHPAEPRYIKGHKTPTPDIPLLILQSRADLIAEKERLKQLGYYRYWK